MKKKKTKTKHNQTKTSPKTKQKPNEKTNTKPPPPTKKKPKNPKRQEPSQFFHFTLAELGHNTLKILSQMYKKSSKTNCRTIPHLPTLSFVDHLENMGSFKNRRCYLNCPEQKHCVC